MVTFHLVGERVWVFLVTGGEHVAVGSFLANPDHTPMLLQAMAEQTARETLALLGPQWASAASRTVSRREAAQ